MSCRHCRAEKARKQLQERGKPMTYYDLLFNAIVEAKASSHGWGYKRAEKFAERRLAEIGMAQEAAAEGEAKE